MGQVASRSAEDQSPQIAVNRRSTLWRRSNVPAATISPDHENLWPSTVSSTTRAERRQTLSGNRLSNLLQSVSDLPSGESPPETAAPSRLRRLYHSFGQSVVSRRERGIFADEQVRLPAIADEPQQEVSELEGTTPGRESQYTPTSEQDEEATRASRQASRRSSLRIPSSLSDRLLTRRAARQHSSESTSRRRRPAANRPLEDNTALLSRLLSVAAAATAATLLEGSDRSLSEARGQTMDGDDGSFGSFLQSLESGQLAAALRQGTQQDSSTGAPGHTPLNFFRMFRFGTTTTTPATATTTPTDDASETPAAAIPTATTTSVPDPSAAPTSTTPETRMVPIIIVGIRAVTPGTSNSGDAEVPPFLDALSSLPQSPFAANAARPTETVEPITRTGTQRPVARRRASDSIPARGPRSDNNTQPRQSRPTSVIGNESWSNGLADASSASSLPFNSGAQRAGSIIRTTTTTTLESPAAEENPAPQERRTSESDRATGRSAFASRRNGVVEPDVSRPDSARSWIIYVLGGSYPENHPILTTPSLFTDSPTYEDMMLLSALLGPAKAPVASGKDIEEAGGLYTITNNEAEGQAKSPLVAVSEDGQDRIPILAEQRCLVCLCDLEKGEEARKLRKCEHLFHKECIDQVSTAQCKLSEVQN